MDFELVQGGNLYIAERDDEVAPLRQQLEQAHAAGLDDVRLLAAAADRMAHSRYEDG